MPQAHLPFQAFLSTHLLAHPHIGLFLGLIILEYRGKINHKKSHFCHFCITLSRFFRIYEENRGSSSHPLHIFHLSTCDFAFSSPISCLNFKSRFPLFFNRTSTRPKFCSGRHVLSAAFCSFALPITCQSHPSYIFLCIHKKRAKPSLSSAPPDHGQHLLDFCF